MKLKVLDLFSDIKSLSKEKLNECISNRIDIVCGGFPCQPFSVAGKKKGRQDDRDLWPEMFRVIKETRPRWVIGENVANFVGMEFSRSKTDLESIGYTVLPFIIPACAVGAQHRRNRVWIVAHLDSKRLEISGAEFITTGASGDGQTRASFTTNFDSDGLSRKANATKEENTEGNWQGHRWTKASFDFGNWWGNKSGMGRAIHGVSDRVDRYRKNRIKALGNSIVPQIAYLIGKRIVEIEMQLDFEMQIKRGSVANETSIKQRAVSSEV